MQEVVQQSWAAGRLIWKRCQRSEPRAAAAKQEWGAAAACARSDSSEAGERSVFGSQQERPATLAADGQGRADLAIGPLFSRKCDEKLSGVCHVTPPPTAGPRCAVDFLSRGPLQLSSP